MMIMANFMANLFATEHMPQPGSDTDALYDSVHSPLCLSHTLADSEDCALSRALSLNLWLNLSLVPNPRQTHKRASFSFSLSLSLSLALSLVRALSQVDTGFLFFFICELLFVMATWGREFFKSVCVCVHVHVCVRVCACVRVCVCACVRVHVHIHGDGARLASGLCVIHVSIRIYSIRIRIYSTSTYTTCIRYTHAYKHIDIAA